MENEINEGLDTFAKFLDDRGLSLAKEKTKAIIFSRRKRVEETVNVTFEESSIEFVKEIKYLEVILNCKLRLGGHIDTVCASSLKAIM